MIKAAIFSILVIALAGFAFQNRANTVSSVISEPVVTEIHRNVVFFDISYAYSFFVVDSDYKVTLLPNYSNKETTINLNERNECIAGINGGFYDKENRPLGWVKSSGKIISKRVTSRLFNGFVGFEGNQAVITEFIPDSKDFGFQTGPVLIKNAVAQRLSMAADKQARRIILAINNQNLPVFISVYDDRAPMLGPKLGDLPEIIQLIGVKENYQFIDAINLDGGNASAFFSPEIYLKENTPVGAWLCVTAK